MRFFKPPWWTVRRQQRQWRGVTRQPRAAPTGHAHMVQYACACRAHVRTCAFMFMLSCCVRACVRAHVQMDSDRWTDRASSSAVKPPPRLLLSCTTPTTLATGAAPRLLRRSARRPADGMATQSRLRVRWPLRSSSLCSKRLSAYASASLIRVRVLGLGLGLG